MKKKDISLSDITSSPIRSTGMRKPKRKTLRLLQRYRNNAPVGLGRRVLFLGLPTIAAILVVAVLVVQIQIARGQQTDISFERPERSSIEVDILPEQNLGRDLNPGELIQLDQAEETDIISEDKIEIMNEADEEPELPSEPEVTEAEPTKAEPTDPVPTSKPKKVYANTVLNFRASPGTNGAVLGQLMYGEAVTELAKDEGWSYVKTYQGVEGYVKSQYLQDSKPAPKVKANEPAPTKAKTQKTTAAETTAKVPEPTSDPNIITTEPPPESLIRYVNVDMANIRTEPNADSVRVGFAQRGTVISLIKVDGEWAEIKTESGLTGYMMTNLFQKQKIAKIENNINMGKDNWVTVSYGYLRAEPSTESEAIGDVRLNEKVYQISTDGIWSKVKLANGNTGYLRNDLLTAVKPETPPQEAEPTTAPAPATQYRDTNVNVYVTVSYANLRESDSTDSAVVGSAVLDEKLTQLSTNGSWSKIKKSNGLVAYISNGIISTTAPGSEETQTEQPAEAAFKEINKKAWVSVYSANVRKEPNTVSSIVTKLGYADSFTRISSNGTWSFIETEDGKKGYMINSLISTKEIQKPEIEPESEEPETDANAAKRRQVVDKAMSALGVRYVFGGSSMNGFDCSGLVMWAYASIGVNLPHSSNTQGQSHVKSIPFSHSDYSNLRLGDLLFFGYSSSRYSHVGIYVGNGKMIHAPRPGAVVRIEGFAKRSKPLLKVGRIIN